MLDQLGDCDRPGQAAHDMNMINPSAREFRKATDLRNMVAEHFEHLVTKLGVLKKHLSIFCAENDMEPNL